MHIFDKIFSECDILEGEASLTVVLMQVDGDGVVAAGLKRGGQGSAESRLSAFEEEGPQLQCGAGFSGGEGVDVVGVAGGLRDMQRGRDFCGAEVRVGEIRFEGDTGVHAAYRYVDAVKVGSYRAYRVLSYDELQYRPEPGHAPGHCYALFSGTGVAVDAAE
ncbi:unknown [Alistipes sp. CAG:831]|nr:unknown [Alistipes sp. CAG:831]